MKNLFLTWILILGIVGLGIAQTQKTLVKTFAIDEGYTELTVTLDADIEVEEWDNNTIRIITEININTGEQILKALIKAGRYNYETNYDAANNILLLNMPKKDRVIVINEQTLKDDLILKIYVPKGMKYNIENPNTPMIL